MLALNTPNFRKKGKIIGRIFNLFMIDERTSIIFDGNDFLEPILFATRGEMAKHLRFFDKLLFNATPDTVITVHTYKWSDRGWTLFGGVPWTGKIADISKKNW